jgi:hypothetical protein
MSSVTIAKRNAGSLTDPNGYYPKLFDKTLQAKVAWELVKRWRAASLVVSSFAATLTGREAQLAVHGNRFIEHMLVSSKQPITNARVAKIHARLNKLVHELHGTDCYLAVLFKNTKKCEVLQSHMLAGT